MNALPDIALKARLNVVLATMTSSEAAQTAVRRWMEVEPADEGDFERLLLEAILQALPEDARLLAVVTLAHAFVDRLTEACDGLL